MGAPSIHSNRFPLLRNLVLFQAVILALGLLGLVLAIWNEREHQVESLLANIRAEIEPHIIAREQQWRAWKYFGLNDSLKRETGALMEKFPIRSIDVIPPSKDRVHASFDVIILPVPNMIGQLNLVVVAQLDTSRIRASAPTIHSIYYAMFFLGGTFLLLISSTAIYVRRRIYRPMLALAQGMSRVGNGVKMDIGSIEAVGEMREIIDQIQLMHQREKSAQQDAAVGMLARQVAHDIRSPLTALTISVTGSTDISEDSKRLIQIAVKRIRQIADNLLSIGTAKGTDIGTRAQITPLILDIISEKKLQFEHRAEVLLFFRSDAKCAMESVNVNPSELQRTLSNLLNNAYEAIEAKGEIHVALSRTDAEICIDILDTGKGIMPELINKIVERGNTFGKEDGHGLGVSSAAKFAQRALGSLHIKSLPGKGTKVSLRLPIAPAASWLCQSLKFNLGTRLFVLDDEESAHEIWRYRLKAAKITNSIEFFKRPEDLARRLVNDSRENILVLTDFHLHASSMDGLRLIKVIGLEGSSILVTSVYDDPQVQQRAQEVGVKILPKQLVPYVELLISI